MEVHDAALALQRQGLTPKYLGRGMESIVFDIGNDLLAKVWLTKQLDQIRLLQAFYAELGPENLPYRTPTILDVIDSDVGTAISVEERLPGIPLRELRDAAWDNEPAQEKYERIVATVVNGLRDAQPIFTTKLLPILGHTVPDYVSDDWGSLLTYIVTLRVDRFKDILAGPVHNFDEKISDVLAQLRTLRPSEQCIVHGDICTENVLVNPADCEPIALLDFGFLTMIGDPLFDATVSTLTYDMYSPASPRARSNLYSYFAQAYGDAFRRMYPLYARTYALITSNAYSPDGLDGHFRWCVDILNAQDGQVRGAARASFEDR